MVLPIFQLMSMATSLDPSSLYHLNQGDGDNHQLSLSPSSFEAEQTSTISYSLDSYIACHLTTECI